MLEMVARILESGATVPDGLAHVAEFVVDHNSEATWDHDADALRTAGRSLVEAVAPVMDNPDEFARRIDVWAQEWSFG